MTELTELGAVELRRLIGSRRLSPVELLQACADRIAATNPEINAFVEMRWDEAWAEARAAEAAVAGGELLPPLHGLPVGVKEATDVAGMHSTQGSPLYCDNLASRDDPMVVELKRQGAVIVGKTNLPELQHGMTTRNSLYGLTLNPHDPAISCQGSSGGAAVALAADMVPLCTASDTGGSIRGPAATNGVFGLRPTPGLVGRRDNVLAFSPASVLGPMARSVDDLALLLSAMVHPDTIDPFSADSDGSDFVHVPKRDAADLRVAVSADLGCVDIDPDIRDTFERKIDRLRPYLGDVTLTDPDLGEIVQAFWILRPLKFLAAMGEAYKADPSRFTEYKRTDMRRGFALSPEQLVWAFAEQSRAYAALTAFMRDYDVLITPGWATLPLTLAEIERREAAMAAANAAAGPFEYDFSKPEPSRSINPPITLTGHPVVTLPCGLGPTGHPFALNLIGRYRCDRALLGVAAALEAICQADTELARARPDLSWLGQADP